MAENIARDIDGMYEREELAAPFTVGNMSRGFFKEIG